MANALLLQQIANGALPEGTPNDTFSRAMATGENIAASRQARQQNALNFQQAQQGRQMQMAKMQRDQQLAPIRNDIATWALAEKQGKGQEVWAQLAKKYGQDPNADPKVIIPKFLQDNPGVLPAEVQTKLFDEVFAPKAPTKLGPGDVLLGPDNKTPLYMAPNKPEKPTQPRHNVNSKYSHNVNSKYSQKELQAARDKLRVIGVAKQQLENLKAQRDKIKDSIASGPGAAYYAPLSEAGSNFDSAVDQMRDTITGLTRTPGVGAMSDFETRLSQAKMPSRNEYESSRDQKIKGLEDYITNLESGYKDLLAEGQQPQQSVSPANEQDILDAADAILSGQ